MRNRILAVVFGGLVVLAFLPGAPAPADVVTPASVYNYSNHKAAYTPELAIDGIVGNWLNMWVAIDDTMAGTAWTEADQPITGHIVLDMGAPTEMGNCRIWAREYIGGSPPTYKYGPKDVKFFYFQDDNPVNILGAIDDVENDPNIVEAWSGTLQPLPNVYNPNDGNNADSEIVTFTSTFTRRYIGMRVDSSYSRTENFQVGEIAFGTVPELPGVAPVSVFDYSAYQGTYLPENVLDAKYVLNGELSPSTFWVAPDDDGVAGSPVTGHIVLDMGSSMELRDMAIWARQYAGSYLPKDVKVFGFADDNPLNTLGEVDDIESDPNIVEVWSGTLQDLKDGLSQIVTFGAPFTGRYIGLRIDSSYEATGVNFQIGEIRLNAGGAADVPGDANRDGKVDDLDASILAANWQRTGGATWAQADFNSDGNVNDLDASILAANWQYGVGAAVPEPSAIVLLVSGLLAWAWGRRRGVASLCRAGFGMDG